MNKHQGTTFTNLHQHISVPRPQEQETHLYASAHQTNLQP